MKNLMKIFSILLVGVLVTILIGLNFNLGESFTEVLWKIINVLRDSLIPILIIAVSCVCLQKKTEGILMNIVLAIASFSVVLSCVITFLPLNDINVDFANIIMQTQSIISMTNIYLLCFSLLKVVSPNNLISNIMQKTGYISLIVNIVFQIWLCIKENLVSVLPNVYGHEGFDFASLAETSELVGKVFIMSFIVEAFAIVLTYITNHAFEVDTIDVDQMDYDELKKQADSVAQSKFNSIYTINSEEKKEEPKQVIPTKPGVMNINNQLGANSSVGQIENKESAPISGFVDRGIPTSSGPVINNNLGQGDITNNNTTPNNNLSSQIQNSQNTLVNNTASTPMQTPPTTAVNPTSIPQTNTAIPVPTPMPMQTQPTPTVNPTSIPQTNTTVPVPTQSQTTFAEATPQATNQNNPTLNNSPLAQALGNAPQTNTSNSGQTNKFLN